MLFLFIPLLLFFFVTLIFSQRKRFPHGSVLKATLYKNAQKSKEKRLLPIEKAFNLVEVTRLELTTSWTRTMRATTCATPRRVKKTNFHPLTGILYNKTAQIATKITPFSEKIFYLFFVDLTGNAKSAFILSSLFFSRLTCTVKPQAKAIR